MNQSSRRSSNPGAQELKKEASFAYLAYYLGFDVREGYSNYCPLCGKNKLSVSKELFHCFRAGCKANTKSGDIYTFLQLTGKAESFKAAYRMCLEVAGYDPRARPDYRELRKRTSVLEDAFKVYNESTQLAVWDYLLDRGIRTALRHVPVGYSGSKRPLTDRGYSHESLEQAGLLSRSGKELFTNHVIFPIFNRDGRLVHLQGRSLEPNTDLRWINTRAQDEDQTITRFLFNEHNVGSSRRIYLTEGVTDGLTLIELVGVEQVVSCIGTSPKLTARKETFEGRELVAIFDNDQFIDEYNYSRLKSWASVLKPLLELKIECPTTQIYCIYPPNVPYVTDLNDWLINQSLTTESFTKYVNQHQQDIFDFVLDHFPALDFHGQIMKFIYYYGDTALETKLNRALAREVSSYTGYMKELIERGLLNI